MAINTDMKDPTRTLMAFAIVAMFAFMLIRNPTDTLIQGALIAQFAGAVGYYLGGSKVGSDTATQNAATLTEAARKPSGETQPVEVVNDADKPIPVENSDGR